MRDFDDAVREVRADLLGRDALRRLFDGDHTLWRDDPTELVPLEEIERLLEGFAYLSARVQLKLDAEFPRFTQRLLEIVYPNYLAPMPAMLVAQFEPQLDDANLESAQVRIASGFQAGDVLTFTAASDVTGERAQLKLVSAEAESRPTRILVLVAHHDEGTDRALRYADLLSAEAVTCASCI